MILPTLTDCAATIDRHWPAIIYLAARSAIVMGVAGAAVFAMRRASASARHWVWLLGFIGLLILPVLSAIIPKWRVLPWKDDALAPVSYEITELPVLPELVAPEQIAAPIQDAVPSAGQGSAPVLETSSPVATASAAPTVPVKQNLIAQPPPALAERAPLPWTFWIAMSWIAGACAVFARVALGSISLWWLQSRCTRIVHGPWWDLLSTVRRQLDLRCDVRLLRTPLRTMPMTWGIWRTRILLPDESADWPAEQRRAVLLHELAHVRRRDCLTQFVAQLGCAIYWFNPLVWLAWRRMQIERERACDDLVLMAGEKASAYARHLLDSAAAMPSLPVVSSAALAMARAPTLEERLRAILDLKRNRHAITLRLASATALLVALALVPVAALRAQQQNPPTPPAAPAPAATTAPAGANLSIEERMRLRRLQGLSGTETPADEDANMEQRMRQRRTQFQEAAAAAGAALGPPTSQPSAAALLAARGGARGIRGAANPLVATTGQSCLLDATIYEIRLPSEQIAKLDADALARAAGTALEFEKALGATGTAKPLYRARQSVRLAGDSISIGQTAPYVRSVGTSRGGIQNTVGYTGTGVNFDIAGQSTPDGMLSVDMFIQVSSLTQSRTALGEDVKAPVFHTATLTRRGAVRAAQPFVMISANGTATDESGKAAAYVARVTLGAPQGGGRGN